MIGPTETLKTLETNMEAPILILTILILLVAFDLAAVVFGADSRDQLGDDHQRSILA
jgi:hypothetical protein